MEEGGTGAEGEDLMSFFFFESPKIRIAKFCWKVVLRKLDETVLNHFNPSLPSQTAVTCVLIRVSSQEVPTVVSHHSPN